MDLWEWISTTTTVDSVLSTLGLGALAVLFATDRIMTKGQHERRVADIVSAHEKLLVERADRYSELRESRDYYREARLEERHRNDELTEALVESVEVGKASMQALRALDEAASEVNP